MSLSGRCFCTEEEGTDRFALAVADQVLQLLEGGQPAVAIVLPGDPAQEVGQPRLL